METIQSITEKTKSLFTNGFGGTTTTDFTEQAKGAMEKSAKMAEDFVAFGKGNIEALVESSKIAAKNGPITSTCMSTVVACRSSTRAASEPAAAQSAASITKPRRKNRTNQPEASSTCRSTSPCPASVAPTRPAPSTTACSGGAPTLTGTPSRRAIARRTAGTYEVPPDR